MGWKRRVLILSLGIVCGATIALYVYKLKADKLKLAEETRICRVRAEQGDPKAEFKLGSMYKVGRGVPQDRAQALLWFGKAANQGSAEAQYEIGSMYHHGIGVPKDDVEAVQWYGRAANQGYPKAQGALGFMYGQGLGTKQSSAQAVEWYRKAADQGDARGEYNLGYMYRRGQGVPQDNNEAIRWYCKAASQADPYALQALGAELTMFGELALLVQLLGSVWLLSGSSLNPFHKREKVVRAFQGPLLVTSGILGVFSTGLAWYGYSHFKIRPLRCGFDAFTSSIWLLNGVWVALLAYIILSKKTLAVARTHGKSENQ